MGIEQFKIAQKSNVQYGDQQVSINSKDREEMNTTISIGKEIFNPFSDLDRFRLEAFRRIPGVVNESEHLLRTGKRKDYYIDFDPLINDPLECRTIVKWYVDKIHEIVEERPLDALGFIEKDRDSGGTTGVIRLAGAISIESGIPNFTIRLGKELIQERIKFRSRVDVPFQETLLGLNIAVLSDHSTTGTEVLRGIDAIKYRGGTVTDFIVYSLIKPEFQFDIFNNEGIKVHNFLNAPDDLEKIRIKVKQELG